MVLDSPILSGVLNSISLEEIKRELGPPPWSHPVVLADHIAGAVIYQESGHENDCHCHSFAEWWVVMEGEIDWIIEGREDRPVHAKAGDFVYVPALTFHHIFPRGDGPSIRVGIALPGAGGHLHERPEHEVRISIES